MFTPSPSTSRPWQPWKTFVALIVLTLISARGATSFSPAQIRFGRPNKEQQQRKNQQNVRLHASVEVTAPVKENGAMDNRGIRDDEFLIHWKGEGEEGYSIQFRLELECALQAVVKGEKGDCQDLDTSSIRLEFQNALNYSGTFDNMPEHKLTAFNEAMQYVRVDAEDPTIRVTKDHLVQAVERCSLIHAAYQVVAEADSYEGLSDMAVEGKAMEDMQKGQVNQDATWCVRVRHYGEISGTKKEKRHGERARSLSMERVALKALTPLLLTFGGGVDLMNPDCKLYVFDGVTTGNRNNNKVLARRVAVGPRISSIAPATRICVTNTPLCPIAAYLLCNVAGIRSGDAILDVYAGSCAVHLAAAMICDVYSVGIEIAHNGLVNRDDILKDFETRQLTPPLALLKGDSTDPAVREEAIQALSAGSSSTGKVAFDFIITDPPYGIRESTNYNEKTPIQELLASITYDRDVLGRPLLRKGGKLVCFLPCSEEESLEEDVLPSSAELEKAGLELATMREQPLNDSLSRWLVVFTCVR